MGNHIPEQLALFFRSILLGGGFALVYDLARPLRLLGGRKWGCLLDSLVSAGAVVVGQCRQAVSSPISHQALSNS